MDNLSFAPKTVKANLPSGCRSPRTTARRVAEIMGQGHAIDADGSSNHTHRPIDTSLLIPFAVARSWTTAMAHSIVFSPVGGYVEVGCDGIVDHETILRIVGEIAGHPDRFPGAGFVWDIRNASLSGITLPGMEEIWRVQSSLAIDPVPRVAVVFARVFDDPLLNLWRSVGSLRNAVERRHFRDIDEARRWAGEAGDPSTGEPASHSIGSRAGGSIKS